MLKKSIREKLKDKGIEFVKPILTIHKPLSPDGVVVGLCFRMDEVESFFTYVIPIKELNELGMIIKQR